jgi:hypothetical protein
MEGRKTVGTKKCGTKNVGTQQCRNAKIIVVTGETKDAWRKGSGFANWSGLL